MKEIIEGLTSMFFLMLMFTLSMCCISSAIDYRNADATKTSYIAEIENSNFSRQVMSGIFNEAEADGYVVRAKLYHRDGAKAPTEVVLNADEDFEDVDAKIGDTSDVYMVRLEIDFNFQFPLLKIAPKTHTIIGYAR